MQSQSTFAPLKFAKSKNSIFYKVLRQRVNEYFKKENISRHANASMVFKTVCMVTLYLAPFILIVTLNISSWAVLFLWAIMGLGMAGCGLSVMHDANHGAYSKNPAVNNFISKILIILAGNPSNWRIQHNVLHHTYTNVSNYDEDIAPPPAILRFSPHTKRYKIHRFQHFYAYFFYGLMTITWFINKDYEQALRYNKMDLLKTQGLTLKKHLRNIIVNKLVYSAIFIALPFIFSPAPWYITLVGYLLMQFITGFILGIIFQPAHVVPTSTYPLPTESGDVDADWAVNQMYNTANFAQKSRLFSWYVGGLNFQVEHHLFPNICHIHYKKLSEIVRATAEEFEVPYHSYKTFIGALKDHTQMLYKLGNQDVAPAIHH